MAKPLSSDTHWIYIVTVRARYNKYITYYTFKAVFIYSVVSSKVKTTTES